MSPSPQTAEAIVAALCLMLANPFPTGRQRFGLMLTKLARAESVSVEFLAGFGVADLNLSRKLVLITRRYPDGAGGA